MASNKLGDGRLKSPRTDKKLSKARRSILSHGTLTEYVQNNCLLPFAWRIWTVLYCLCVWMCYISGQWTRKGAPIATNVVLWLVLILLVAIIEFSNPQGFVNTQSIVIRLSIDICAYYLSIYRLNVFSRLAIYPMQYALNEATTQREPQPKWRACCAIIVSVTNWDGSYNCWQPFPGP